MSNAIRTLAVAAAMACVAPMAAQAAAITLTVDFNNDPNHTWTETTGGDIDFQNGVRILNGKLVEQDNGLLALVSAANDPVADPITILLTGSLFHLTALEINRANSAKLSIHVVGVKGGTSTLKLDPTPTGVGGAPSFQRAWLGCADPSNCTATSLLAGDEFIQSIDFTPGLVPSTQTLDSPGLNLMNFTLVGTTDPGTVPEPAGYGLAALALLAAGAASRRRAKR